MKAASALYRGEVYHRRLRPKVHALRYRVFWLMLDLAELDDLSAKLSLFSHNRFNLFAFYDRDYADGSGKPLRPQVEAWLAMADVDLSGGPIRLLTMPRVLGYVFNPISLYYCYHADGSLKAMVYEVTSTFGIRHAYVIPVVQADADKGLIRQGASKALYVSPFMGMDMDYAFRGHVPSDTLDMTIDGVDSQGVLITAVMKADRRNLDDRALFTAFGALPFLTLKVMAAIHWEALKLWLKGVGLTRQPAPAAVPLSVQRQEPEHQIEH